MEANMNKMLVMSAVFLVLFLFHGVIYTAAWLQCGSGGKRE
jgi:hypothetical protein